MDYRHWPRAAQLIMLFGALTLVSAVLTHLNSMVVFHDRIGFGGSGYWSPIDHCFMVSPGMPNSWPAVTQDLLRPSDCFTTLDGTPLVQHSDDDGYLTQLLAEVPEGQLLTLQGTRSGQPLLVRVPALRLTVARLLDLQLALFIPGLALWFMGWLVLTARPSLESNRTLGALLFLGAMLVMPAINQGVSAWVSRLHGWFFVWSGRPFLGALLFHLAFLFPDPPVRQSLQKWRLALYPLAALAFMMSIGVYLIPDRLGDYSLFLHRGLNALILALFLLGNLTFLGRTFFMWRHAPSTQSQHQVIWLRLALIGMLPLAIMNLLVHDLRFRWLLPRVSNSTLAFWLIPAAGLLAYAMLRFQGFAYRGLALNALVVMMMSATLTQVYAFFLAPRGWGGVQFVTVWGAVLLTTLFWYVDSPVRRTFRRLFVRHEFDFQIAEHFSQQMAITTSVDDTLARAARFLCDNLDLAWVALSCIQRRQQLWLAQSGQSAPPPRQLADDVTEAHLPDAPAGTLPITHRNQPFGTIWLGPRTTAEPVDDKDQQLVTLLSQELARTLAMHTHIEDLEQVPGQILTAVEADRNRIGQDLHDSVLQFLGAVPLELDQASQLVDRDPTRVQAILERTITQAEIVAQETRASVYDLSPPILLRQGVVAAARVFAEQACTGDHVQLTWHIDAEAAVAWQQLPEAQAVQVYRILQQAVDNALAHAHPTRLTVQFGWSRHELFVEVIDDGVGFATDTHPPAPTASDAHGLGLISMQARARALGGVLHLVSAPGQGTTVALRFPQVQ